MPIYYAVLFLCGCELLTPEPLLPCQGPKPVDEDVTYETEEGGLYYPDADGDGFGDAYSAGIAAADATSGDVTDNTDCDDTRAFVHPEADEYCNQIDDDCDGVIDAAQLISRTDLDEQTWENLDWGDAETLVGEGKITLCDGTYAVNLTVRAETLALVYEGNGSGVTLVGVDPDAPVITIESGDIELQKLTISDGAATEGGGLHISGPDTTVSIIGGTIVENRAILGAGLFVREATVSLDSVNLLGNAAESDGGAFYIESGEVTLRAGGVGLDTDFNLAPRGAGFFLSNGELWSLQNSFWNDQGFVLEGGGVFDPQASRPFYCNATGCVFDP